MSDGYSDNSDYQKIIAQLLQDHLKESRKKRRWGIFFKSLFIIFVIFLLIMIIWPALHYSARLTQAHVSVVDIDGAIMPDSAYDAEHVVRGLTQAFRDPVAHGVLLRINSPGGAPVQASYIYDAIMHLRQKYPKKQIYAVCSDLCASAAYYVASATNKIYADPSSLVGSIGVLYDGFGFTNAMDKLGIQRRLITAGPEKGFLDPFSPLKPEDKAYLQQILDVVHQQFIDDVKKGRGDRLKSSDKLFSGLVFSGIDAKKLGLIDGFGSPATIARTYFHTDKMINYTEKPSLLNRISENIGANFTLGILGQISQFHWL